ncbi:MAG: hypothetical protein ACRELC_12150 [Gemmatimonadota bacterium]
MEPLSWERVAVFPFLVRGADEPGMLGADRPGLGVDENGPLGEGLAGLLSTAFEGAGGVRTIDPRALASRLAESVVPFDPDLASTVAESLGAAAYVLGEGVVSGAEIRLTAALYRPGQSFPIAHAEVKGAGDSALSLVDGLAVSLLTSAYPDTRLPLAHGAREITESPAALKEYLAGERPFRTGRFAAAHAAYQRAVARDTAFALAHHRLSVTAEWFGDRASALESARRAVRHSECLIERDRRLIEAHLASLEGDASEAEGLYRAILETWPHDLEARYQLGAILLHGAPAVVHSLSEARREFERIRALHPSHVPSLVYLARIAAREGRRDELERLVDRLLRSVPRSPHAWEMRALRAFVVGSEADQVAFAATLRDASDPDLRLAVWSLAVFGGELEVASRLAELMTEPGRSPETQELGRAWEVELALARGRWALARRTLPDPDIGSGPGGTTPLPLSVSLDFLPVPDLALQQACDRLGYPEGGRTESATDSSLAAVPPVRGEPTWPATRGERASRLDRFRRAVMCSRAGDFDAALSAAVHLEQAEADPDLPSGRLLGRIVRAHVAWLRGLPDDAADLLDEEPGETQGALTGAEGVESFQRYLRAIVLADAGKSEEALQWFGSFEGQHIQHLVFLAPAHFHQAHLLEELGRRDAARRHYWTFLRLWREADPELGAMRWEAVRNLTALRAG